MLQRLPAGTRVRAVENDELGCASYVRESVRLPLEDMQIVDDKTDQTTRQNLTPEQYLEALALLQIVLN